VTAPTIATVTGWRPEELHAAADRLLATATRIDDDARVVRRHLGDAVDDAGGVWATTAAGRADQECRWGRALADACTSAAAALSDGAARLGEARRQLLDAVHRGQAAGFEVLPDGRVESVGSAPLDALGLSPEQRAAEQDLVRRGAAHEEEIAAALHALAAADESAADLVAGVEFAETLPSLVAAHAERTRLLGGDPVAALGTAGAVVVAGHVAESVGGEWARARAARDVASLARAGASADEVARARRVLAFGSSSSPLLKVAGRVAMPMTIVSGVHDARDGGGYDGVRGWATRGFGAAGAVGAGVVLAGAATTVLAPGLVAVGGAAVVAYGLWSTGNYVVDHWDQVADAADAVGDWVRDEVADQAAATAAAVDWAGERLAEAGSGLLDGLGELF